MRFNLENLLESRTKFGPIEKKMFWKLNKGIKEDVEKHIDKKLSRRDFLKAGLKIAGTAAIANSVPGFVKNVFADVQYPPGIEISKKIDEKTANAYHSYKSGNLDFALGILDLIDVRFRGNPVSIVNQVNPNTHKIDPGYHVVASLTWSEILNFNGTYTTYFNSTISSYEEGLFERSNHKKIINTIEDKNMLNCANGIIKYMIKWYVKDFRKLQDIKPEPEDIEKTFLSAIFGSAGINNKTYIDIIKTKLSLLGYKGDFNFNTENSDELARSYMKLPDNRFKKIVLDETLNLLNQLKKDSKELLISAWSSFWLTNHYFQESFITKKKENRELMSEFENEIGKSIRIRGPPYYYNSDGNFNV